MKIVIELSLIVNIFLNSFILLLTSFIIKDRARIWFLSAFFGGIISLFYPLFKFRVLSIYVALLTSFIMVMISFKVKNIKDFAIKWGIFAICTLIFGGGVQIIENIFGVLPLLLVAGIGSVVYFLTKFILSLKRKEDVICGFSHNIKIVDNGVVIEEDGFLDSGNVLYDSITKKPVILITYEVFSKLYSNITKSQIISKTFEKSSIKNCHYIKINSIGSGTSLLVFSVDKLSIDDKKYFKNVMLGLSFSCFEKSFGSNILLHSEFVL